MKQITICISILFAFLQGHAQNEVISADDSRVLGWAESCTVQRGLINMTDSASGLASFGDDSAGTGQADGQVVSLGDHGSAVLHFPDGISNGPGTDFAVFENALYSPPGQDSMVFAELAFVEVSSDGNHFVRFPAISYIDNTSQLGGFEPVHVNRVYNLAGATVLFDGCGFDLNDLQDSSELDINHITHIRLVDAGGNIDPDYASTDSEGEIINDPWPTEYESCGFDLDAVAVLHTSTGIADHGKIQLSIHPNPVHRILHIDGLSSETNYRIFYPSGKLAKSGRTSEKTIDVSGLPPSVYILRFSDKQINNAIKFIR
jgi:hypothetical protein